MCWCNVTEMKLEINTCLVGSFNKYVLGTDVDVRIILKGVYKTIS